MANISKDKASSEQPLGKTLSFLTKIAGTCVSMSVVEIAEELKVSKPTAYAIVNTLVAQNFLEKDPDSGKFHIGYAFYAAGQNYPRLYPFLIFGDDYVNKLYEKLNLRTNICIYKEPMTALVVASKDRSLVPRHLGGYLLPAHISASGKMLLSALPEDVAADRIRAAELYATTSKTITDPEQLIASLAEIRHQGFAYDMEELVPGSACIAAPVFNAMGNVIYTISLSRIPIERFHSEKDYLIEELRNTAYQISADMGYSIEARHKFIT